MSDASGGHSPRASHVKRALPILGLVLVAALLGVLLVEPMITEPSGISWTVDPWSGLAVMGLALGLGVVGALLSWHRPEQPIGWLMLAFGVAFALQLVLEEILIITFVDGESAVTAWMVVGVNLLRSLTLPVLATLMVLFPSGRPPGRWWRVGIAIVWASTAIAMALAPFIPYEVDVLGISIPSPRDLPGAADFEFAFVLPVMVVMAAAGVRIVSLLFRGTEVERHQVRWLAFTLALVGTILLLSFWVPAAPTVAGIVAAVGIPASIAVAILRYRLFEIDVIISRSLSFGVLVVFIGGVYVGIVVGVGALVGRGGGSGFGLSVVATAVVALGFQPVRVRVERWANRLVFGRRATPYEVLARFSHRAAEESDGDVVGRIPRSDRGWDGCGGCRGVGAVWGRVRGGVGVAWGWGSFQDRGCGGVR